MRTCVRWAVITSQYSSLLLVRGQSLGNAGTVALYNFRSTLTGTHFLPQRTLVARLGLVF